MTSPHITIVTEANFEKDVLNSDKLVLIDFYAEWCSPCKALAPTLEAFAEENKDTVKVVKINVDESPNLAAAFQVKSIPTLITMKDGQAIFGTLGNLPKSDLEKLVAESMQELDAPTKKPSDKGPTPK